MRQSKIKKIKNSTVKARKDFFGFFAWPLSGIHWKENQQAIKWKKKVGEKLKHFEKGIEMLKNKNNYL